MAVLAQALGIALALGGLLLWAAAALPPLPTIGLRDLPEEPLIAAPLPAAEDGYAVLTGLVVYGEDGDTPVPYIAYELPEGGTRTKQLIFRDRGCSPAAGDIPCALGTRTPPELPERSTIRVAGMVNGDQIFVERIEGIY